MIKDRYWDPLPEIQAIVAEEAKDCRRIVDVGASMAPWEKANEFIDFQSTKLLDGEKFHNLDINKDPFPFQDKEIDFIYCRHTIEDIYNPYGCCKEFSRVAKAGYIETPSAIAEVCHQVDSEGPPWRGYIHHRYLVWHEGNILYFLPKYPFIEYVNFGEETEEKIEAMLNATPFFWNNYFFWKGHFEFRVLQNDTDFLIRKDYRNLLVRAINATFENITSFLLEHHLASTANA